MFIEVRVARNGNGTWGCFVTLPKDSKVDGTKAETPAAALRLMADNIDMHAKQNVSERTLSERYSALQVERGE